MCEIDCTQDEIVAVLGASKTKLARACKKELGKTFDEFYQENRMVGNQSLRRKQWTKAMGGDKTMLVWLGKNRLGQSNKHDFKGTIDHTLQAKQRKQAQALLSTSKGIDAADAVTDALIDGMNESGD